MLVGSGRFRAFVPGRWLEHFELQGDEFGYTTAVQYLRGAQRLTAGGDSLTHVRSNGDILFYDRARNEFGVLASDGQTILTYFRPVRGYQYWLSQLRT